MTSMTPVTATELQNCHIVASVSLQLSDSISNSNLWPLMKRRNLYMPSEMIGFAASASMAFIRAIGSADCDSIDSVIDDFIHLTIRHLVDEGVPDNLRLRQLAEEAISGRW